jgi:hypothetical protein
MLLILPRLSHDKRTAAHPNGVTNNDSTAKALGIENAIAKARMRQVFVDWLQEPSTQWQILGAFGPAGRCFQNQCAKKK